MATEFQAVGHARGTMEVKTFGCLCCIWQVQLYWSDRQVFLPSWSVYKRCIKILSWGHKCLVGAVTMCMHAAFSGSCVARFKQLSGERQLFDSLHSLAFFGGLMWAGASGPSFHLVSMCAAKVWGGTSWPDAANCVSSTYGLLSVCEHGG